MKQIYIFLIVISSTFLVNGQTNSFSGNGNTGFGGFFGDCTLDIDFQDSSTTETYFTLYPGSGSFNDKVVIYIDSDESGNFTNTYGFTDNSDPLRTAISGFNGTDRSGLDFPPGFEADYAIAFDPGFGGLWSLADGTSHGYIGSVNFVADGPNWTFYITNTDIGNPTSFKFIATYISGTGFRSNEAIGSFFAYTPDVNGNPGYSNGAFDTYFTTDALIGGFGSTTSIASVWSFDGSWSNGNVPFDTDYITINHDLIIDVDATVGVFDINASNTVTINAGNSLTTSGNATYSGDFINDGSLIMNSISTQYSSLIVGGSSSGSGTNIYNRHVNGNSTLGDTNAIGDNDLITPPVSGQSFGDFATANVNLLENPGNSNEKAFAPFDKTTGAYENFVVGVDNAEVLNAGDGYRAATSNTNTLAFQGTVNTGNFDYNIVNSGPAFADWNLVGNPYPSYLLVQAFLSHIVDATPDPDLRNIDLFQPDTGAIYGYDGDVAGFGGYTIYNLSNTTSTTVITPGQGFLVSANPTYVGSYDLEFRPSMRSTGSSDDFIVGRNTNELVTLKLNLSSASEVFPTEFYFNENASLGLDPGYDAAIFGGSAPEFALYSLLVEEDMGTPFAIQTLGDMDFGDTTVPLGVNSVSGVQLTFSISENTLPSSTEIYLDDTVANTSTLLNSGDHVLTPSQNLNGTGRFYLRFSNTTLSTPNNELDVVKIYSNYTEKTIVIAGQLLEDTIARVYDIQGRLVASQQFNTSSTLQTIDASILNSGVYIVELSNKGYSRTEKIIIK